MRKTMVAAVTLCVIAALDGPAAAQVTLPVMTYNTKHGRDPVAQMNEIAQQNPRPDVVVFQEMPASRLSTYINGLSPTTTAPRPHKRHWSSSILRRLPIMQRSG
jgi:hypothetical protein